MSVSPSKSAHKEIKRVAMACKNCRTRKLKCRPFDKDLGSGDCERCVEQHTHCIYEPIQKPHDPPSPPNFIQSPPSATHPARIQSHVQSQPSAPSPSLSPIPSEHPSYYAPQPSPPSGTWNQPAQAGYPVSQGLHQPQLQYPPQQPILPASGSYPQHSYPHFLPNSQPVPQHSGIPGISYPSHMNSQQQQLTMAGQTHYMPYTSHAGSPTQENMLNQLGSYVYPTVPIQSHPYVNMMSSGVPAYTGTTVLHQPNPSFHQDPSLAQWQYQTTGGHGRNEG